jgi:hypothetical protein
LLLKGSRLVVNGAATTLVSVKVFFVISNTILHAAYIMS